MNGHKSVFLVCALALLMVLSFCTAASAFAPQPEPPKEIKVLVDDTPLVMDVAPIIRDGRTLVPMRAIFESQGASVRWDPAEQSALAQKGSIVIQLWIGSDQALVNGLPVKLDVPPIIFEGRTMGPARFISESLGASVEWDPEEQTVLIKTSLKVTPDAVLKEPNASVIDSINKIPVLPIAKNYTLILEYTKANLNGTISIDFGGLLTYTNYLSSTPVAAQDKEISIYKLAQDNGGTERILLGTAMTDSNGAYDYTVTTTESNTYVAVFAGENSQDLAVSDVVTITVNNSITIQKMPVPMLLK
jgi:hypothetical protein